MDGNDRGRNCGKGFFGRIFLVLTFFYVRPKNNMIVKNDCC